MYIVKRYDIIHNIWSYMNVYKTFHSANIAMENMKRLYKGIYRIEKRHN